MVFYNPYKNERNVGFHGIITIISVTRYLSVRHQAAGGGPVKDSYWKFTRCAPWKLQALLRGLAEAS